jgi:hypothetical protein
MKLCGSAALGAMGLSIKHDSVDDQLPHRREGAAPTASLVSLIGRGDRLRRDRFESPFQTSHENHSA